jgi:ADP-ribose pyrophosphatase YjhB (NUDIX family)
MHAIANGAKVKTSRGDSGPPKSVASKYTGGGGNLPESKGKEHEGGRWPKGSGRSSEGLKNKKSKKKREEDDKKKSSKEKKSKSKDKEKVKKSFEQYYNGQGAGVVVTNDKGQVLVGKGHDGKWQTPGGHVDPGEDFWQAARRELKEEAGITATNMIELGHFKDSGNDSKAFHVSSFSGKPKDTEELKELQFADLHSVLDWDLRTCSMIGLKMYAHSSLKKSNALKDLVVLDKLEKLEKNILRGQDQRQAVYDISHGEALKLVGNGCFRFLKRAVDGMGDEDFRDIKLDTYVISVRKHTNDVYSGRINDGHKTIHQFTNKSLPQLCADVMSVFEWYSDKDEHVFDILDENNLPDDTIHGGLSQLSDNYKRHNLANIYTEMEAIRGEIRNGMAVDLQQVEKKIMGLFDKLENSIQCVADKHNQLANEAGKEVELLEEKLRDLQLKIDELNKKPTKVEAYQTKPVDGKKVYDDHYMYLPKPKIEVGANGKITISFDGGWTDMEKSNFLTDMKARIIKTRK